MIAKGLLAGLIGGVAGSAAKLIGEAIYPPRTLGQEAPPALFVEKILGKPLSKSQQTLASQGFHWTFGSGLGAAYGVAAEFVPQVTALYGVAFGWAVLVGTHESVLPALGLVEPPLQQPPSEIATHALYGFVTELVRRLLMRYWRRKAAENEADSAAANAAAS
jgi:putative membrane protein